MDRRLVTLSLVLPFAILAIQGVVWGAADCGEPAPAPRYQLGEKWTWRDEKDREWSNEVIRVEGDVTQMRWANGDVAFHDKDWIIQQVRKRNGGLVTKQGAGQYTTVGQKVLDFPLQVGKTWEYDFLSQPRGGLGGLQTYNNSYRVVVCEEVSTVAGKFPAFKLEGVQRIVGTPWSGTFYLWYAPAVKNYVKRQYPPSQFFGGGRFLDFELVKYESK